MVRELPSFLGQIPTQGLLTDILKGRTLHSRAVITQEKQESCSTGITIFFKDIFRPMNKKITLAFAHHTDIQCWAADLSHNSEKRQVESSATKAFVQPADGYFLLWNSFPTHSFLMAQHYLPILQGSAQGPPPTGSLPSFMQPSDITLSTLRSCDLCYSCNLSSIVTKPGSV